MTSAKSTALSHGGPANDLRGHRQGRSEYPEPSGRTPNIDRPPPGGPERRVGDPAGAPSVGAVFRRRREEYGLAVEDIEADLCIRKGYLEAIETGDYDILPGTTYALGFVRAYADHIGLDAEQMVRRFKVEALGEPAPTQGRGATDAATRKRKFPVALTAAVAIAAAAGFAGWKLSSFDRGGDVAAVPAPVPEAAPVDAAPAPVIQPVAADTPPSTPVGSGDFEAPVTPTLAAPGRNGQADASIPVDPDDQGGDVRLTPRPKGRPIPTGPVFASPPPAAEPAAQASASAPALAPPAAAVSVQPATQSQSGTPSQSATPSQPAAPVQQAAAVPPAEKKKAEASEKKAEQPQQAARPTVVYGTPGRARVSFTAVDTTRVRIHSTGGEVLFDGVLLPGDVYRVPDRPGLMLMTESAGGLKFTVDGGNVPSIGPKGALRHNVFLNPMLLREGRAAPH